MVGTGYSIWTTLVLVGVLALIPLSLWVVKRFTGFSGRSGGSLRVVDSLSVGPRERIVVIHTGQQYLLVGSTTQQISLLQSLDGYAEPGRDKSFDSVFREASRG